MKKIQILLLAAAISFLATSCAKWGAKDDDDGPYKGMSEKKLYTEAKASVDKKQYKTAARQLEALESMYPFSDYAEQAQLNLIYSYYQDGDYPSAAATAERFIHLYPRAARVDYAYYMKGLANFQQTRGALTAILPMDESWRDPGTQSQAYNDFAVLIQRFPNSSYKANALQRMIYLRNMFAKRELNTAQYYYQRKMYVAAVERANYLVKNYPQAPSAKEGLAIMYRANKALGLAQAAHEALTVYQATYHTSIT